MLDAVFQTGNLRYRRLHQTQIDELTFLSRMQSLQPFHSHDAFCVPPNNFIIYSTFTSKKQFSFVKCMIKFLGGGEGRGGGWGEGVAVKDA